MLLPGLCLGSIAQSMELVRQNPTSLKARFLLAKEYMKARQNQEAIPHLIWVIRQKRAPTVLFHLALAHAKLGQLDKAVPLWLEIVQNRDPKAMRKPISVSTLTYLGLALHKQGSHTMALEWFQRVLDSDPANVKARLYGGVQYFRMAKAKEEAKAPIPEINELYGQAAREWLILLKAKPPTPVMVKALSFLGQAMSKRGDFDRARKTFERLLKIDPGNKMAQDQLARLNQSIPVDEQTDPPGPTIPVPDEVNPDGTLQPPDPATPPFVENVAGPAMDDLQAEEKFLEGLEHKESGAWDKALLAFVQAIELDPKFTQVYLQLGEVYIQLAKLAPNPDQFQERLGLALSSYEKVMSQEPGSLNAHAAQGQIIETRELLKEGFFAYHLKLAQAAAAADNPTDAFEDYLVLLSNQKLSPELFHGLSELIPKLEAGALQDMQFYLEDLVTKVPEERLVAYLLGHTYLATEKKDLAEESFRNFRDAMVKLSPEELAASQFDAHAQKSTRPPLDRYLLGAIYFGQENSEKAVPLLTAFKEQSRPEDLFFKDADSKLMQLRTKTPSRERGFSGELEDLVTAIPRVSRVFSDMPSLDEINPELLNEVREYTKNRRSNMVAKLALVLILDHLGKDNATYKSEAHDLSRALQKENITDPDWHFEAARQALIWNMLDLGRAHLKVVGDILIARNHYHSALYSSRCLDAMEPFLRAGKHDAARTLVEHGRLLDTESLEYYLARYTLDMATGDKMGAVGNLIDWVRTALSLPFHRMVLLTDLGVLITLTLLLTLFLSSAALVIRHFQSFQHLFLEYGNQIAAATSMGRRAMLTVPVFVFILFIALFPTGFIAFFPLIAWPVLTSPERRVYGTLVALLVVMPLMLSPAPLSQATRLKMIEEVRTGTFEPAIRHFSSILEKDSADYVARFERGLAYLRSGDLESARKDFLELYDRDNYDHAVLVNLGVVEARSGDVKQATALFNEAVARDPLNTRAFFNLSVLMKQLANEDKAAQYLKWATAASQEPALLSRYKEYSPDLPQMVLMDHPLGRMHLDQLFSPFSLPLLMTMLSGLGLFVLWFVAGGGLASYLVFLRERMSIVLKRCQMCRGVQCSLCLTVEGNRELCDSCHPLHRNSDEDQKRHGARLREDRYTRNQRLAWAGNLVVPGVGLFATASPAAGAFLMSTFFGLVIFFITRGGWLANLVFSPRESAILKLILAFALVVAFFVYVLAQAILYHQRDSLGDEP